MAGDQPARCHRRKHARITGAADAAVVCFDPPPFPHGCGVAGALRIVIQMPYPRTPQMALSREEIEHVIALILSLKQC